MLPNQMNKDEAPKAYAKAQVKEVMTFRQFVAHIAEHGGHKRGQVKGVLSDTCSCLVEQLLEGKKILLDDLGNFWISLTSTGAENCEAFTSKNITGVRIIFTPGEDFENLLGRASFNLVASRTTQAASLKAEMKGEDTVDLVAAKNKGTGSSTDPTDPNDPKDPSDSPVDPGTSGGGDETPVDPGTSDGEDTGSGSGSEDTGSDSGSTGGESGGKDPDFE